MKKKRKCLNSVIHEIYVWRIKMIRMWTFYEQVFKRKSLTETLKDRGDEQKKALTNIKLPRYARTVVNHSNSIVQKRDRCVGIIVMLVSSFYSTIAKL